MRTVMYLRISKEDASLDGRAKRESDSIAHQRWMLSDFVRHHPDLCSCELDELCDDGWSGKNFGRPGVTQLLEQVRQGKVQCIVVKDISRFGRDYLAVGNYVSRVFPFMGVRFIAVNDNFDSARPGDIDSLDSSFKTLIYDIYSRELSHKVRSAMRRQAEQGLYVNAFAPYGYKKDDADKHRLAVDEPAASVVRRIFQMALDGRKPTEICKILNGDGVITPMQYKWKTGVSRKWKYIHEDNFWMPATIRKILQDERYTGAVVFGKRTTVEIGKREYRDVGRDEWIVCEDRHEGIIPKEDFEKVQKMISTGRGRTGGSKKCSVLSGRIFCGVCGHSMTRGRHTYTYFRCATHTVTDKYACDGHGIAEDGILAAVRETVQHYSRLAAEVGKLNAVRQESSRKEKKDIAGRLISLQNEKQKLDSRLQELYEGFVGGELSREKYLLQKSSIAEREREIADEMKRLEQAMTESSAEQSEAVSKYIGYAEVDEMTEEMMDDLLKRVTVYPENVLEIQLNFADELDALHSALSNEM